MSFGDYHQTATPQVVGTQGAPDADHADRDPTGLIVENWEIANILTRNHGFPNARLASQGKQREMEDTL